MRAFPVVQDVRGLRDVESDDSDKTLELVIWIKFGSLGAIVKVLNSTERYDSREKLKSLIVLFEGDVFHTVLVLFV